MAQKPVPRSRRITRGDKPAQLYAALVEVESTARAWLAPDREHIRHLWGSDHDLLRSDRERRNAILNGDVRRRRRGVLTEAIFAARERADGTEDTEAGAAVRAIDDFLVPIPEADPLQDEVEEKEFRRLLAAVSRERSRLSGGEGRASMNAKDHAPPPGERLVIGPVVDEDDLCILQELAKKPHVARTIVELAGAVGRTRKTVGQRVRALIKANLVSHPPGRQRKVVITTVGLARVLPTTTHK